MGWMDDDLDSRMEIGK